MTILIGGCEWNFCKFEDQSLDENVNRFILIGAGTIVRTCIRPAATHFVP